jgi:hypothetical protein
MLGNSALMVYSFYILDIAWDGMTPAEGSRMTSRCSLSPFSRCTRHAKDKVIEGSVCNYASDG